MSNTEPIVLLMIFDIVLWLTLKNDIITTGGLGSLFVYCGLFWEKTFCGFKIDSMILERGKVCKQENVELEKFQ